MANSPQALFSEEETERLEQIMSRLRSIQKITGSCLETMEEMLAQAREIAGRHGMTVVRGDGDVMELTRRNGGKGGS